MKIQQADDCREAVYSNDYYDLILDYVSGYPRGETECYQRVSDQYDIAYFAREGIPALNLQDYPYQTIPKCFGLTDLSALGVQRDSPAAESCRTGSDGTGNSGRVCGYRD